MNRLSRLAAAVTLVLATLVASCNQVIVRTMVPTPIVMQDERLDFSRIVDWIANQRVSSDVLLSMVYPFDPAWRGLVHGPGLGMWNFPDDYPRRVSDAVCQGLPAIRREARSIATGDARHIPAP